MGKDQAQRDTERSAELRCGGAGAHAAAVRLGRKGGSKGGRDAHRIGGLARAKAFRRKGGRSTSPAKVAAARANAEKARAAKAARKAWEDKEVTSFTPVQITLLR
jgi:hypothetical protein